MLVTARRLIFGLTIANWIAGVLFVAMIALFAIYPSGLETRFGTAFGANAPMFRSAVIAIMMIGIAVCLPTHILFDRLLAIIDSVRAGRPFVTENADRLRHIAWALLAIQLLDLAFGAATWQLAEATSEPIGWSISLTGWISVVLLFVLARIFQQGATMQEELEATV